MAKWVAGAALLAACWPNAAQAQSEPAPIPAAVPNQVVPASEAGGDVAAEGGVVQTSCSSCGGGLFGHGGGASCGTAGCPTCCYAGREPCDCPPPQGRIGRCFHGLYECICCPDPCYEPRWLAVANNAFFQDAARPVTQMRLRWDTALNMTLADKAEFFWARADGNGKGPRPPTVAGRRVFNTSLDYSDITMYTEAATGRLGVFVELAYVNVQPDFYGGASGFGDMNVGTKTLLLDCELIQSSFQFKTFIPTGNFTRGLGTGHVALEPALLTSVKLTPEWYLQNELAFWFPIGGDQSYQGPVFHWHLALNRALWKCGHGIQLVGSLEANGWDIAGGRYTSPVANAAGNPVNLSAKDIDIVNVGPGARLIFCDKVDLGLGTAFALTSDSFGDQIYRVEFRWRF
jgi:hypothetical protein